MSTAPDSTSFQQLHEQLAVLLEDRVTELMTQIKTSQGLARQVSRTEEEIDRQRLLREQLVTELDALKQEAADLSEETAHLEQELGTVSDAVDRLRSIRDELAALRAEQA